MLDYYSQFHPSILSMQQFLDYGKCKKMILDVRDRFLRDTLVPRGCVKI